MAGFPLPGSLCCNERDGIGGSGKSSPSRTGLSLDVELNLGGFFGRLPVGPSVSFKLGTLGTRAGLGSVAGCDNSLLPLKFLFVVSWRYLI